MRLDRSALFAVAIPISSALGQSSGAKAAVPSPRDHLGFSIGADRTLADWGQITGYFQRLATASRAVHVDTIGLTTNGQPFIVVAVSTPGEYREACQPCVPRRRGSRTHGA